ncbi:histidine triad nucleotide-binding protein [Terriglobus saanensis]|uniref:Histidine triad (HIT) protein n=1 Tax=Terriglobus saanensis (strain ATCC BAA-1853 / DSM 23119 / SP1PR4) TaxID=401053 RepID=E8V1G8_TERSS|nr:histidine triad nucleotide-binding protein [Terriglobus saanensis]ADV81163.1 histidine triad (HIT) protein [Terriglobus saanensis SP1PR4]
MEPDCIFCRIVAGEIPATKVYEDDLCLAFRDLHPVAPTHVLLIPKGHVSSQAHALETHEALLGHLVFIAAKVAGEEGLTNGFRTVINTGDEGGQTVHHLHLHVLGGRQMHWPPG